MRCAIIGSGNGFSYMSVTKALPEPMLHLFQWASFQISKIAGCLCAWECSERFPRNRGLAMPTCITARTWRTCRDACRDRQLAVSFEVGGGENVPGIPGACATSNFTYLVRGPWRQRNLNQNTTTLSGVRCALWIMTLSFWQKSLFIAVPRKPKLRSIF